jgi:MFS family permease
VPLPRGQGRLLSPAFLALLVIQFLGFAQYHILQAVLPVLIITQGGDATLAGFVIATHSVPSVLLRPPYGWLIDRHGSAIVLLVGAGLLALSGFVYFLPGIGLLIVARLLHGTAWAAFSAAGYATLVQLTPVHRRIEASGFYNLMPGIAQTLMPAAAFALVAGYGFFGGLVLSAAGALLAFLVVWVAMGREAQSAHRVAATTEAAKVSLRSRIGALLSEPAALRPLVVEMMFSFLQPLFLAFAPVYALALGLPLEIMPVYFLSYGGVLIAARMLLGTRGDRYARVALIGVGVVFSLSALAVLIAVPSFAGLIVAGALFAVATTLVSPTIMALTMDLAPPGRVGSAMATYSLGFPLATGGGAALWGVIIDLSGFSTSFLVGATVHLVLLFLLLLYGDRLFGLARAERHRLR